MKIRDIERHLRINIPRFTTRFHEWINISSFAVSSGVATIETAAAHNFLAGAEILLNGVTFVNPLNGITHDGLGNATATTSYPNDLSFYVDTLQYSHNTTVELLSSETDFNGTFDIVQVFDRRNFVFSVPTTAPLYNSATVELYERDLPALNGVFSVLNVIDSTHFRVSMPTVNDFTAPAGAKTVAMKNIRIAGEISAEHAYEAYTAQPAGKYWMFLIAGDTVVSRDRNVQTDFQYRHTANSDYWQETSEPFSVLVFIPSSNMLTPVDAQDECRNELKSYLIKNLCAYFPQKLYDNSYRGIFFISDGMQGYNKSVYVHEYLLATTVEITINDCYIPSSIAIHGIDVEFDIKTEMEN